VLCLCLKQRAKYSIWTQKAQSFEQFSGDQLHNKGPQELYWSSSIVRVKKQSVGHIRCSRYEGRVKRSKQFRHRNGGGGAHGKYPRGK
jgi:hypothetical protein